MSCEEFLSREVVVGSAIKESANKIKLFVERHHSAGRLIVLVTVINFLRLFKFNFFLLEKCQL